jgi:hypothetical protein
VRLWSLHPACLDAAGLVSAWREGLLARAVLRGVTRGYRYHPQLARFRGTKRPIVAIDTYLAALCDEADRRGYRFDRSKLGTLRTRARIPVTRGQVRFEWTHLAAKLRRRDRGRWSRLRAQTPRVHPSFRIIAGRIEAWERWAPEAAPNPRRKPAQNRAGAGRPVRA